MRDSSRQFPVAAADASAQVTAGRPPSLALPATRAYTASIQRKPAPTSDRVATTYNGIGGGGLDLARWKLKERRPTRSWTFGTVNARIHPTVGRRLRLHHVLHLHRGLCDFVFFVPCGTMYPAN